MPSHRYHSYACPNGLPYAAVMLAHGLGAPDIEICLHATYRADHSPERVSSPDMGGPSMPFPYGEPGVNRSSGPGGSRTHVPLVLLQALRGVDTNLKPLEEGGGVEPLAIATLGFKPSCPPPSGTFRMSLGPSLTTSLLPMQGICGYNHKKTPLAGLEGPWYRATPRLGGPPDHRGSTNDPQSRY